MKKKEEVFNYTNSIIEVVIFFLVLYYTQNIWILIIMFLLKTSQIVGITNYEGIEDENIRNRIKTYIYYLKNNGVFSFLHINDQIVGFGSLFCVALIIDQKTGNEINILIMILMSCVGGLYWLINNSLWSKIKTLKEPED